ncbi:Calcium/calmodulin-dependent protein kinase [Colletotrichum siamense]|uniref:Calcium/calmodulin-dependent protein kinase n=1 Tax=Colletotrichum siamense TaxID=690259 RepID=UPI0018726C1B|nr:Calcium/calmodulin-dependent protein kinase [Colletotrichum siamense]KAF5511305.1 Calcium/calmodulin-dependent protein kinase [Colletotrichum siamense]
MFSDGLPSEVVENAKRLFAILVMIGEPQAIRKLVSDGLTDDDLPFARPEQVDSGSILESKRRKKVKSFQDWRNDAKVDIFLDKQWLFLAPVLDLSGGSETVDAQCPLPFLRATAVRGTHSSTVYKSELHVAHQKGARAQNSNLLVAVKVFQKTDADVLFEKERKNLQKTRGIDDRHLIQHLFCCERKPSYFIVFPWADGGNLRDFWKLHTSDQGFLLWSLQQMLGISGALRKLHDMNCRHGDLKPANILYFKHGGLGNLVIADVGVSKVHKYATNLREGATNEKATTPAYEPPEAFEKTNKPRPRRYDIWSMACIYLEFIVWIVHGFDAVASFASSRDEPNANFFRFRGTVPEIHPSVMEAISALRHDPRCKGDTALAAIINLITEHLLRLQVDDRVTAEVLYNKLDVTVQRANRNPSFIMRQVDRVPATPDIFRSTGPVFDGPTSTYT